MRLTLVFLLAFFLSLSRDSFLFSCGSSKKGIYKGFQDGIYQFFLSPSWALSQQPMRPKTEWAVDSEAMRAREIIVLVKSNWQAKRDSAAIVLVFKAGAFRYWWAITYSLAVAQPIRTQH